MLRTLVSIFILLSITIIVKRTFTIEINTLSFISIEIIKIIKKVIAIVKIVIVAKIAKIIIIAIIAREKISRVKIKRIIRI